MNAATKTQTTTVTVQVDKTKLPLNVKIPYSINTKDIAKGEQMQVKALPTSAAQPKAREGASAPARVFKRRRI